MNTQFPSDDSNDPADDAPQRRKERGAAADGSGDVSRAESVGASPGTPEAELTRRREEHREEVVGQGSGETAGGSPATAQGEKRPAKLSTLPATPVSFDPREFAEGGVSSNTPPSIPTDRKQRQQEAVHTTGGEDTLEASLYVNHRKFGTLNRLLDRARDAAEQGAQGPDELQFDGVRCLCLSGNASAGKGKKRIAYRWRLQSETGIILHLIRRESAHPTLANAFVRIGAVPLMRFGTKGCWSLALQWLQAMDVEVVQNKLSRIDACHDNCDWPVAVLGDPYRLGHYVSRGKASAEHSSTNHRYGRRDTGFSHGQGNVRVRAYDKLFEVRNDPVKRHLLSLLRWGGLPEIASRVETQLRRNGLKQLGIDTVEDWFDKRAAALDYLLSNWFRLTDGPVDPKHPERSEVLPVWLDVRRGFADWAGDNIDRELAPLPTMAACTEQLRKQLYGLTVSILMREERPVTCLDDYAHEGLAMLLDAADGRDIGEDVRRKRLELGLGAPQ